MLKKLWHWLTKPDDLDLNNLTYFMDKDMDQYMSRRGLDQAHTMYIIGGSHVATSCPLARRRRLRECTKMVDLKGGHQWLKK